jgi:hypothetical protein
VLSTDVVDITPLTFDVITSVEVENVRVLFDITELVATTPLIVVVKVLPERD